MRVFLPMDKNGQPRGDGEVKRPQPQGSERRRYPRHRYTRDVEIHLDKPGSRYNQYDAVSFEISEGGMSAATPNILFMGEKVELYPIVGSRLAAIVRRKHGAMYGFEFVGLGDEEREATRKVCEGYRCLRACWMCEEKWPVAGEKRKSGQRPATSDR